MLEFAMGLLAGVLLWPWWAMGILSLVCVADILLVELSEEGWATGIFLIMVGALVWMVNGNPFSLGWQHLGDIALFGLWWLAAGALWSLPRYWLYLMSIKEEAEESYKAKYQNWEHEKQRAEKRGDEFGREAPKKVRPHDSYMSNNIDRLYGWVVFWPFSIIGTVFGDFLNQVVKMIATFFSSIYEQVAGRVFSGWEDDGEHS